MKNTIITTITIILLFFNFDAIGANKSNLNSANKLEFSYEVKIPESKGGKKVELWIPLPQTDNYQKINELKIETDFDYSILKEDQFNNQYLYVYAKNENAGVVKVSVKANRFERNGGKKVNLKDSTMYLGESTKVLITDKVCKETQEVIKGVKGSLNQAKAIYDHIVGCVKYDKSGQGWGNGDVIFVCDERRGNCTDFHSLFIAMCRSINIPARFAMGFPFPEKAKECVIKGYHCWAEFFIDGKGWIPVDASEAFKHPEKKEYLFGNLDYNRLQFTMGRDIQLKGGEANYTLNYFIYPYCLVNGKEFKIEKKFYYKKSN
jgi:transglutaminase-like putative cysteine protease